MKKQFLLGLMAMLLPLTTWAADDAENTFSVEITNAQEGKITYNGDATKPNISVKVDGVEATAGEYTIKYFKVEEDTPTQIPSTQVRNVGKYKIEVSANGDEYFGYEAVTVPFEVTHKVITTLEISNNDLTREYDGTTVDNIDLSNFITDVTGLGTGANEKEDFLKCLYLKRTEGGNEVNVGGSTIRVEVSQKEGETESNYKYDATGRTINVPLTITPKTLTLTFTGREYKVLSGVPFETTLEALAAAKNDAWKFGEGEVVGSDDVTISLEVVEPAADAKLINVGTYKLKPTVIGKDEQTAKNYTFAEGYASEYKISKAKLTIAENTEKKAEKTYGSVDPSLYELFTYTVNFPSAGTELAITKDKTFGVTMTREIGEDVKYNDKKEVIPFYGITINGGDNFEIVGYTDKSTKLKINPLKLNSGDADEGATASANITFAQPTDKSVFYAAKDFVAAKVPVEGLTLTTKDLTITALNKALVPNQDYTLVYSAVVETNTTPGKAIDAGDKFNITLKGQGNFTGGLWSLNYTVKKDTLTITPKEDAVFAKVYDGQSFGNVTGLFNFEGLHELDEEEKPSTKGVLTMNYYNMEEGKTVPVDVCQPNGNHIPANQYLSADPEQGLKNYIIKYTPVKFTTLAKDFTLDGDPTYADGEDEVVTNTTKIQQYAGLEVNEPTIKNLTSLQNQGYKADRWYTLVLPFDVTVREISNMFGYAIVNVPQKSNDNPETMVFRLTMDKIPAHTLMAFKVDATQETDVRQNPTLTFVGKKKIVAIPNEWFADAQGNKTIGTYEAVEIEGEKQFFLLPNGGDFYRASQWFGERGTAMTITPFNGYFDFEKTPANARLILEEADGSTTAINAVTGETIHNAAEGWYTIGGVKLNAQPTEKGVYINNGMKVVIK